MSSHKIVIVGGGAGGGAQVARSVASLLPTAKVTLINPLPYSIMRPTLARMTVSNQNDLFETALVPYDKLYTTPNGSFVEGIVETIRPARKGGEVILADGKTISYDVLVLAPGSVWEGPLEFPTQASEVAPFVAESRSRFKNAEQIVLAGGGSVAVEFAGEIKDIWPSKGVTIVHSGDALLNSAYSQRFRKGLEKDVVARGVKLVLNDYVDDIPAPGSGNIRTRNGKTIQADLVISTRGPRPRTEFVSKSLGSDSVDERGQIKVKPTLQLNNHADIFALGDAINIAEQKQVVKATAHAAIISANIVAYLNGKTLKPYKGSPEMILVTNGKNGGKAYLSVLGGTILGAWFVRMVKSKTLFVDMSRGNLGY